MFIGAAPRLAPFDANQFRLLDELKWRHPDGSVYITPAGTLTDFASVPRVAVWLIPKFGRYTLPAIMHDERCIRHGQGDLRIDPRETDEFFRMAMQDVGTGWLRRWMMWTGVRWGAIFNRHRRRGAWMDLLRMLPFTLLGLVIVVPPGLLVLVALVIYGLLEFLAGLLFRCEDPAAGADVST